MNPGEILKYKDKGRTGLANIGNTCYINSCLQCLSHTHELNKILDDPTYKTLLNNNSDSALLVEWDNLRNMMWSRNCVVAPHGFVNAIHKNAEAKKMSLFIDFEQNDMQEFLIFLMESFHKGISKEVEIKTFSRVNNNNDDIISNACYKMLSAMYEKDYSDIIKLFYGIHASVIISPEKSVILSVCAEPFFVLSLPMPDINNKKSTIYECFDEYCKKDRLDGDNSWFNEKTSRKQSVDKGIVFWSFPDIVIL